MEQRARIAVQLPSTASAPRRTDRLTDWAWQRDAALPGSPPLWLLWSLPIIGIAAVVPLFWLWEYGYLVVADEDRLAEWLTFVVYLATSSLCVAIARRLARAGARVDAALYVVAALATLFVAGEEVSWFQRQLGYAGPEQLVALNKQDEANVHNVLGPGPLEAAYVVVGLYGSIVARTLVPRLALLRERPWLYAPPVSLAAWFACTWIYYGWGFLDPVVVDVLGPHADIRYLTGWKLQEPVELALACGFFLFALRIVHGHRVVSPHLVPSGSPASA